MEVLGIKDIVTMLVDIGFQATFVAGIFYIWFKYANKKLFSEENMQKARDINDKLDKEENDISRERIAKLQKYLDEHWQEFFDQWIDRVSVWLNHNWTRKGKVHFLYYSLVAETVSNWLERFDKFHIKLEKLPYYMFAEYEEKVHNEHLDYFIKDIKELWPSAISIAKDTGAKSMYIRALDNVDWWIDWLLFCSYVFEKAKENPLKKVRKQIANIRTLFLN